MTRRTAKTFEPGEAVEMQRSPGTSWIAARYCMQLQQGAWHEVLDDLTGNPYTVPSRRIRKRSVTK